MYSKMHSMYRLLPSIRSPKRKPCVQALHMNPIHYTLPFHSVAEGSSAKGEEEEAPLIAPFPAKLEKGDAFTKLKQLVRDKS